CAPVDEPAVRCLVDDCLTDPADRWHLRHYRERIETYYTTEECSFVLPLLDILSVAPQPLGFGDLFNLLKHKMTTEDAEMTRSILTMLQRDHYILQEGDGRFRFR